MSSNHFSLLKSIKEMFSKQKKTHKEVSFEEEVLIQNVLVLQRMKAQEVMLQRSEIPWIASDSSSREIRDAFSKTGLNTLVVCEKNLEDVKGLLDAKMLLQEKPLSHLKEPIFISPTMACTTLLSLLEEHKQEIALVVDEYGIVDGLVSLSSLIQRIVEKISGIMENQGGLLIEKEKDDQWVVDGRVPLKELECVLETSLVLPEVDIQTIAGLVIHLARHVPSKGEVVEHPSGIKFVVLSADLKQVKRLQVKK